MEAHYSHSDPAPRSRCKGSAAHSTVLHQGDKTQLRMRRGAKSQEDRNEKGKVALGPLSATSKQGNTCHHPPASLRAAEPQPEAWPDPEPRQQTQERSPLLRPSSSSGAASESTGARFEPNQNKTSTAQNVPAQGVAEVWVSSARGHRGCCVTKQLWAFGWQTSPFGSHHAKLLCQEHAQQSPAPKSSTWGASSSHSATPVLGSERSQEHCRTPPQVALKGLWVLDPTLPPSTHPCSTQMGTVQFSAFPTASLLPLGTGTIPMATKQNPTHQEAGTCRAQRDTARGHQGWRMASTSPGTQTPKEELFIL